MVEIPILNRDALPTLRIPQASGLSQEQKGEWRQIGEEFGFFVCELPGLGQLRTELYQTARDFFSAPDDEKKALGYDRINQGPFGNVGYFSFGSETAVSGDVPDPKEFFHVGPSKESLARHPRDYPSTPWWPSHSEFRRICRTAYDFLIGTANRVCHALCQTYDVDQVQLDEMLAASNSILRLVRYPLSSSDGQMVLAAEHVGIQLLGLQVAPNMGGLQYLLPNGTWVEPDYADFQDCVIVNIGEMGSYLLGGGIGPSRHRVVRPRLVVEEDRYSAVFFFHPDHRKLVTNLKTGATAGNKTWGQWLADRLRELRLLD